MSTTCCNWENPRMFVPTLIQTSKKIQLTSAAWQAGCAGRRNTAQTAVTAHHKTQVLASLIEKTAWARKNGQAFHLSFTISRWDRRWVQIAPVLHLKDHRQVGKFSSFEEMDDADVVRLRGPSAPSRVFKGRRGLFRCSVAWSLKTSST